MNPKEILDGMDKLIEKLFFISEIKNHETNPIVQNVLFASASEDIVDSATYAIIAREMISELDLVYELSAGTGLQKLFHEAGFTGGVEKEYRNRCSLIDNEIRRQNEKSLAELKTREENIG